MMKIISKLSERLVICEYGEHNGAMHIFSGENEFVINSPIVDVPKPCFTSKATTMIIHIPQNLTVELGDEVEFE